MHAVYIISARRTPIGRFGGSLRDLSAADLGTLAATAAVTCSGIAATKIGETIFGHARQAGNGPNLARQISVRAGIPEDVPAYTVNKACASGLKAITLGCQEIMLGNADAVLVGGAESMSRVPYLAEGARWGTPRGDRQLTDGMYQDGFFCPLAGMVMGETVELLASQYGISREEQDAYACRSQERARQAAEGGRFRDEITPAVLHHSDRGKPYSRPENDEHRRVGTTIATLANLAPVFSPQGTITAGNSSGITDGAAALVLASEAWAKSLQVRPLAQITGYATAGVDPRAMGIGPVPAIRKLLQRVQRTLDDYDLIELNEAFAAQVLACDRELHFDPDRLNVNGGAIALGHPIGCTGARIVVTLLHELRKRRLRRGLSALCVSGGLGMALEIEAI